MARANLQIRYKATGISIAAGEQSLFINTYSVNCADSFGERIRLIHQSKSALFVWHSYVDTLKPKSR
jgi:hypothetical protein